MSADTKNETAPATVETSHDVADTKTTSSAPPAMTSSASSALGAGVLQRKIANRIHRHATGATATENPQQSFDQAVSGGGGEVPHRADMERSFGQDFSGVQASVGKHPEMESLGAQAATQGEKIAFGTSSPSKDLVAHELTHVVQNRQSGGGAGVSNKSEVSDPSSAAEVEADAVGARAAAGERVTVSAAPDAMTHGSWVGKDKKEEKKPEVKNEKPPEVKEDQPAVLGATEVLLSKDVEKVKDSGTIKTKFDAWGATGWDPSAVRVAKIGAADAVILAWNTAWGKQPITREMPESMSPIEASIAVAQTHKLKGWAKVDPTVQGQLTALLGGETNELSAKARGFLLAQWGGLGAKTDDAQAAALKAVVGNKDAMPDVVAEDPTVGANKYTLDGPTVVKNYQFQGKKADANCHVQKFEDGTSLKIMSPKDNDPTLHNHSVQEAAKAASYLPKGARAVINTVVLNVVMNPDDPHWAVEYKTPDFHSYMTAGAAGVVTIYPDKVANAMPCESYMKGTIVHETGHTWSYQQWGQDTTTGKWSTWKSAMDKDGNQVSAYGQASISEDVAETIQVYGSLKGSPKWEEYKKMVPNRWAILEKEYV